VKRAREINTDQERVEETIERAMDMLADLLTEISIEDLWFIYLALHTILYALAEDDTMTLAHLFRQYERLVQNRQHAIWN